MFKLIEKINVHIYLIIFKLSNKFFPAFIFNFKAQFVDFKVKKEAYIPLYFGL